MMKVQSTIEKKIFKSLRDFLIEADFYKEGEKYPLYITNTGIDNFIKNSFRSVGIDLSFVEEFIKDIESSLVWVILTEDGYILESDKVVKIFESTEKVDNNLGIVGDLGGFIDYYFVMNYLQFSFAWRLRHDSYNNYEDDGYFLNELLNQFGVSVEPTENPRISKVSLGSYSVYFTKTEGIYFCEATFVDVVPEVNIKFKYENGAILNIMSKFAECIYNSQKNSNPKIAKDCLVRTDGELISLFKNYEKEDEDGILHKYESKEKLDNYSLKDYLTFCSKVLYNENIYSETLPFKFKEYYDKYSKRFFIYTPNLYMTVDSVYMLLDSINHLADYAIKSRNFSNSYSLGVKRRGSVFLNPIRKFEKSGNESIIINHEYLLEVKDGDLNGGLLYYLDKETNKEVFVSAVTRYMTGFDYLYPMYCSSYNYVNPYLLWGIELNKGNRVYPRVIYSSYRKLPEFGKYKRVTNYEKPSGNFKKYYTYQEEWLGGLNK